MSHYAPMVFLPGNASHRGIPALKNTRASSFDVTHAALTPVVPLSRHRGDLREQARTVGTV